MIPSNMILLDIEEYKVDCVLYCLVIYNYIRNLDLQFGFVKRSLLSIVLFSSSTMPYHCKFLKKINLHFIIISIHQQEKFQDYINLDIEGEEVNIEVIVSKEINNMEAKQLNLEIGI